MNFTGKAINFILSLIILIFAISPVGSIFSANITNWVIVIAAALILIHTIAHGSLYEPKVAKGKRK